MTTITDINNNVIELRDQQTVSTNSYWRGEVFCMIPRNGSGYVGLDKVQAIKLRDFLIATIDSAHDVEPESEA